MLNKPKFMSPSINMYGNSVIDLNSDTLPFSCVVDGNESITDWQIVISRLKDNVVVFDSGKQKLDTVFIPINNRNQNVTFSKDLKKYFALATTCYIPATTTYEPSKAYYTYENNKYSKYTYNQSTWSTDCKSLYYTDFVNSCDAYYWSITFWGASNVKTCSASEVFYANSTPETVVYYSYDNNFYVYDDNLQEYKLNDDLILSTDENKPSELEKRKVFLKSTYKQAENVSLKRYGWRITDITNNNIIVDTITQNQIYGVAEDISCKCNGLINQTSYLAELYIETQNGYFSILKSVKFNINYTVKSIDVDFEVMPLNNTSGIMLGWGNLRTTEGVVIGDSVSYAENFPVQSSASIEIPNDTIVEFKGTSNGKDLEISENSYVVLSFGFDKIQSCILFEMSGVDKYEKPIMKKLEYISSNRVLKYTIIEDNVVATREKPLSETIGEMCWYVVTLYPLINGLADFNLVESVSEYSLFPDDNLYPEDLYPDFGTWDKLRNEVD